MKDVTIQDEIAKVLSDHDMELHPNADAAVAELAVLFGNSMHHMIREVGSKNDRNRLNQKLIRKVFGVEAKQIVDKWKLPWLRDES